MNVMRGYGYSEAEVRRHSPAWVEEQWRLHQRVYKLRLADQAIVGFQSAAAAQGAYEEAGSDLQQLIEQLRAEVDASSTNAWITNPDAQTDLEALRASGLLKT